MGTPSNFAPPAAPPCPPLLSPQSDQSINLPPQKNLHPQAQVCFFLLKTPALPWLCVTPFHSVNHVPACASSPSSFGFGIGRRTLIYSPSASSFASATSFQEYC